MKKIIKKIGVIVVVLFVNIYLFLVIYHTTYLIPMLEYSKCEFRDYLYERNEITPHQFTGYLRLKDMYDGGLVSKSQLIKLTFLIPTSVKKESNNKKS